MLTSFGCFWLQYCIPKFIDKLSRIVNRIIIYQIIIELLVWHQMLGINVLGICDDINLQQKEDTKRCLENGSKYHFCT